MHLVKRDCSLGGAGGLGVARRLGYLFFKKKKLDQNDAVLHRLWFFFYTIRARIFSLHFFSL